MTMTTIQFCEELVRQVPDLASVLAEHIEDNDELLPTIFLADVARHLLAGGGGRVPALGYLEQHMLPEQPDLENMIAVSFIEHLESEDQLQKLTQGVETPRLQEEWSRQRAS